MRSCDPTSTIFQYVYMHIVDRIHTNACNRGIYLDQNMFSTVYDIVRSVTNNYQK